MTPQTSFNTLTVRKKESDMNYQEWLANVEANTHIGLANLIVLPPQTIIDVALKTSINLVGQILKSDIPHNMWTTHFITYTNTVGNENCYCAIGGLMDESDLDNVTKNGNNQKSIRSILQNISKTCYLSMNTFFLLVKLQDFNDYMVSNLYGQQHDVKKFLLNEIVVLKNRLEHHMKIEYDVTNIKQYLDNVVFAHQPKNEEQK